MHVPPYDQWLTSGHQWHFLLWSHMLLHIEIKLALTNHGLQQAEGCSCRIPLEVEFVYVPFPAITGTNVFSKKRIWPPRLSHGCPGKLHQLGRSFGLVDNRIDGVCNWVCHVAMLIDLIAHQELIPHVSWHLETWQRGCWQHQGSGFPGCEDVAGNLKLTRTFHFLALDHTTPYKTWFGDGTSRKCALSES